MMTPDQQEEALRKMQEASDTFYRTAIKIGNHPFIEFTGLLNEYIKICEEAHNNGIDFSECNTHSQKPLPMHPTQIDYINEKLECIFTGRSVMNPIPKIPEEPWAKHLQKILPTEEFHKALQHIASKHFRLILNWEIVDETPVCKLYVKDEPTLCIAKFWTGEDAKTFCKKAKWAFTQKTSRAWAVINFHKETGIRPKSSWKPPTTFPV